MAVPYYVYQDNRRNVGTKLWYGRATHFGTVSLDDLAEQVQKTCSLTKSDCVAINTELVELLSYELSNSNCVSLDGLGYFKPAIKSSGAIAEDKFNSAENIKGSFVRFVPEWKLKSGVTGYRKATRVLTSGVEFKKMPQALWKKKES